MATKHASSPPKRPFKICNQRRRKPKGIVCSTLEELKSISRKRFSLGSNCRVFLENDGTEVDDEEYFQFLIPQTLFMVTGRDEKWIPQKNDDVDLQGKFSNLSLSQESTEDEEEVDKREKNPELPLSLPQKILEDPVFYFSLSDVQLHLIVETKELQRQLGCTESKTKFFQQSCKQELLRREHFKEATKLLRICQEAIDKKKTMNTGRQAEENKLQ